MSENNQNDEKNKNLSAVICACKEAVKIKKGVKVACPNCNRTLEG